MREWVERLNRYGSKRQPVLFVISYDKSEALIFSPAEGRTIGKKNNHRTGYFLD